MENSTSKYNDIISYFLKYGFGTVPQTMYYLSILYPSDRVYILLKLLENNLENINLYDKLSMALVKSGNKQFGLAILRKGYDKGVIDSDNYYFMDEKLKMLDKVDNLPYDTQKTIIEKGLQENDNSDSLIEFIQIISQFINENYSNN